MRRASEYHKIEMRPMPTVSSPIYVAPPRPTYIPVPTRPEPIRPGVVHTSAGAAPVVETQQRLARDLARVTSVRQRVDTTHQFMGGISSAMERGGVSAADRQAILSDGTVTSTLTEFRFYTESTTPVRSVYTGTLQKLSTEARTDTPWWSREFTREEVASSMGPSPLDDYIIRHPEFLLGPASLALKGASTAGALALQKVAKEFLAIGAVSGSWESFTNYMKGGKPEVTKGTAETKERVQAIKQDADRYLDGLTSKRGVLSNKNITTDGRYEYYEFQEKCEYMGIDFRKGDYISRDTLHHEWEWFRGPKTHKGPIDPINGKVDVSRIKPERVLRIK